MKKYLTTIVLSGFLITGVQAQDLKTANVPKTVTSALLAKYPESSQFKVAWEKEKGNYEANWGGKSGEDNSALFTPTANFIELVQAIAINKLPSKALAYIRTNKASVKITEAGLVTDAKGTVTYEAEIKGGKELIFDKEGNFIKKA
jgi:hypothetical protein